MDILSIVSNLASNGSIGQVAQQAGIDPSQAQNALHGALEHTAAGGPVEGIVDAMAAKAGISPDIANQLLPMLMPLIQQHVPALAQLTQGSGLLSGLLGGGQQ